MPFICAKKKDEKSYKYWKAEWRAANGRMKQVHSDPAEGKRGLSQDEVLAKARKIKAKYLGINTVQGTSPH
jgi:hypothetical protein